jgi:hypothetical protein
VDRSALSEIADRWHNGHVLKRDVFSTVERGRFLTPDGPVEAVLRHLDDVPWWSLPLAHVLLGHERRALEQLGPVDFAPPLLAAGKSFLVRGWIDGVPLHIAQPHGDLAYFRYAKTALRALHRRGISHNDLAKSQNWLRGRDGRPYLIDFQLAMRFSRRGKLFRIAAYEDLRHLLKHKRRYAETALTPSERRVLARKSWPTRVWMATGKKVYYWITRGLFNFVDREGGGLRLTKDAPSITSQLKTHPAVREAAVVAFPDRRTGTGLYAFVETQQTMPADTLIDFIAQKLGPSVAPEQLQVVGALPRRPSGEVRTELLQLIALNQVDLIEPMISNEDERSIVADIVRQRRILGDRLAN